MDRFFTRFVEAFGPPIDRREVPTSTIERYKDKLPPKLLEYWSEHGWAGYGNGIFWLVNPQEYDAMVSYWLENTNLGSHDTYHLIARSAFGDLYLWGENTGSILTLAAYHSRYFLSAPSSSSEERDNKIQSLLMWAMTENIGLDLFDEARATLGDLAPNEMYGFVPALMLGGSAKLERLQRLDAEVHLILLSQMAELEPYELDDEEAEDEGRTKALSGKPLQADPRPATPRRPVLQA